MPDVPRQRNAPLLLAVAAALVAGLLAGVLWSPLARVGAPPAAGAEPGPEREGRLAGIERELGGLRAAIEALGARPGPGAGTADRAFAPDAPPADSGRVPLAPADGTAAGERAEILAALERIERRLRTAPEGAPEAVLEGGVDAQILERIRSGEQGPNWEAWTPVLELWRVDPDEARKEVKLLTAEQVLDRFGDPTDVWSGPNGITWQYARGRDALDGSYGTEIILRLPDGYVTQLAVRGREW